MIFCKLGLGIAEPDQGKFAGWCACFFFCYFAAVGFTYSAALESVVELRNREDFESCDISNPIRMYTDGLDKVSLDGQGSRYFASGSLDSCKKGLKLHVHVLPPPPPSSSSSSSDNPTVVVVDAAVATGPTPSISPPLPVSFALLCVALVLLCFTFEYWLGYCAVVAFHLNNAYLEQPFHFVSFSCLDFGTHGVNAILFWCWLWDAWVADKTSLYCLSFFFTIILFFCWFSHVMRHACGLCWVCGLRWWMRAGLGGKGMDGRKGVGSRAWCGVGQILLISPPLT